MIKASSLVKYSNISETLVLILCVYSVLQIFGYASENITMMWTSVVIISLFCLLNTIAFLFILFQRFYLKTKKTNDFLLEVKYSKYSLFQVEDKITKFLSYALIVVALAGLINSSTKDILHITILFYFMSYEILTNTIRTTPLNIEGVN